MVSFNDYRVAETLECCSELQRMHRYGQGLALWEMDDLMRMAVMREPNESTVYALCRVLFRPKKSSTLRPPSIGVQAHLGDTLEADWPLAPLHLFHGVPFVVTTGYVSLGGLPEPPTCYLAYCIANGVWNDTAFPPPDQAALRAIAELFIAEGPWRRPLHEGERKRILSQV